MAVRVHALTHTFSCGRKALDAVAFDVGEAESVAILGANGAGKTTLLLRLAGLLSGTAGQAAVAGFDPATDRKKIPAAVGVLFQNPDDQLFCPTVLEEVMFGPLNLGATPAEAEKRAADALARVGLIGCEGRGPATLSGGEKRRAAVAGVLAMRPKVWLLDEPTMYLDPRGRREFAALLNELPGAKLVATHDFEFAATTCTRGVLLAGGAVRADRPIQEMLADGELLAAAGL